jgi:hypothetical protein
MSSEECGESDLVSPIERSAALDKCERKFLDDGGQGREKLRVGCQQGMAAAAGLGNTRSMQSPAKLPADPLGHRLIR